MSSSHPSVSRPSAVGLNFGEFSFFLFFFFSSFLLFLWGFVFVALWACPVGLLLMVRAPLQRTVVLDVSPFPATASRVDIAKCINAKFTGTFDVQSVQFVPGGKAQVPFESPTAKQSVEGLEILNFGGIKCVLIYHYSFECSSTVLKNVLSAYGEVQEVRCQHYPDLSSVSTGMRIVKMVRNNRIPRSLDIGGSLCKVWYRGQPIECDICGKGHVSKVCPVRGKCRRCLEPGHVARDCKNPPKAWDIVSSSGVAAAVSVAASQDPTPADGSGPPGSVDTTPAEAANPPSPLHLPLPPLPLLLLPLPLLLTRLT